MYRSKKTANRKRIGVAAVAATGLMVSGIAVAGASGAATTHRTSTPLSHVRSPGPGSFDPRGDMGRLSALNDSSITVSRLDGTSRTYSLTSSTAFVKDRVAASQSDLAVGETVRVRPATSGAATAAEVDIVPAHVAGQVVSVSSDSIVVSDLDGFHRTISTTSSTKVIKNASSSSLADLSVGEFVVASGAVDANHTSLDASSIDVGVPAGATAGEPPSMGMGR